MTNINASKRDSRVKYYAGIGARVTPKNIQGEMHDIAVTLDNEGYILRSGGARGADSAFESGAKRKEIFLAENYTSAAMRHAANYHPAWHLLSEYAKRLMARNSMILLGVDLDNPVECVICWTPGGKVMGGTGHSLRIAMDYDIPIFNLYRT